MLPSSPNANFLSYRDYSTYYCTIQCSSQYSTLERYGTINKCSKMAEFRENSNINNKQESRKLKINYSIYRIWYTQQMRSTVITVVESTLQSTNYYRNIDCVHRINHETTTRIGIGQHLYCLTTMAATAAAKTPVVRYIRAVILLLRWGYRRR